MSISIVFALALVASQTVITAAGLQSNGSTNPVDDGGFELMRQPVLGFAIQRNAKTDLYRLVSASDPPEVLHIGGLEECEEALVAKLRDRHGRGARELASADFGWRSVLGRCVLVRGMAHSGERLYGPLSVARS